MDIKRREFIGSALAGSAIGLPFASGAEKDSTGGGTKEELYRTEEEVVIERAASGKPHAGKVLAAIQPHVDDVPIFSGPKYWALGRPSVSSIEITAWTASRGRISVAA
jgi:hypothetical protein